MVRRREFFNRGQMLTGLLLVLAGCGSKTAEDSNTITSGADQQSSSATEVTLTQKESELLAGTSRAVCYSGFRSGQHPDRGEGAKNPSDEQILEDLKLLSEVADFNLIRVYDSGENSQSVLEAIAKYNLDIKVMLGIWLQAELSAHATCAWLDEPIPDDTLAANKVSNQEEIQRGIQLANEFPEIVVAVNVGNENLVDWNDHKVAHDSMIGYVNEVKNAIEQPVTVAENYKWWAERGQDLAKVVDFLAVHVYPVWEGRSIEEGMSYSLENLDEVRQAFPEARMVISEAGWATVASEFGERAGESHQQRYFEELMSWAAENNVTTFFFEAFDEDWKGDPKNALGAEKHWGIYNIDRTPKQVMEK